MAKKRRSHHQKVKPEHQQARSAKKVVVVLLLIVLVLGSLSALGGYLIYQAVKGSVDQPGVEQLIKDIDEYPDAYEAAGLPQYPGATVVNLSNKTSTAEDGVSIIVSTNDPQPQVVEFFDSRLKADGWTAQGDTPPADDQFFFRSYQKGGQEYSITITTTEQSSEVTAIISWEKQ